MIVRNETLTELAAAGGGCAVPVTARHVSRWRAYVELTKLRISIMVLAAFVVAGVLAAGGSVPLPLLLAAAIGMLLVSASGNAMNMYIERYTDFLMVRTARRPLPQQRLGCNEVVLFAAVCFGAGVACFVAAVNWQTAVCAVASWILYVLIYTPLKSRTPYNTEIGAVAGAMPVVMGSLATTATVNLSVMSLFGVLFFWQFPHFMAIAWLYRDQYREGGLKMLTVIDPSGTRAARKAVLSAAALIAVSLLPALAMRGGQPAQQTNLIAMLFVGCSLLMGALYLWASASFYSGRNNRSARRLLRVSLAYLPAYLLVLVVACLI